MTFEKIYQLKRENPHEFSKLHHVIIELFEDAISQIRKADERINPQKYKEIEREYQAALHGKYVSKRSIGSSDPEKDIMGALENGEGDKFGF